MKKALAALLIVGLLVACSTNPSGQASFSDSVSSESAKQMLVRLNRDILEPIILENDPTAFLSHSHQDFLVITPGGLVENREQAAAGARSFNATGVAFSNEQVHIVGSTAVVVGRLDIDGEVRPAGRTAPMKFMSVFVREGSDWKLLARSLTPCHSLAIQHGRC